MLTDWYLYRRTHKYENILSSTKHNDYSTTINTSTISMHKYTLQEHSSMHHSIEYNVLKVQVNFPHSLLRLFFNFCQKYHLKDTHEIFIKIHVGLKLEWSL